MKEHTNHITQINRVRVFKNLEHINTVSEVNNCVISSAWKLVISCSHKNETSILLLFIQDDKPSCFLTLTEILDIASIVPVINVNY